MRPVLQNYLFSLQKLAGYRCIITLKYTNVEVHKEGNLILEGIQNHMTLIWEVETTPITTMPKHTHLHDVLA